MRPLKPFLKSRPRLDRKIMFSLLSLQDKFRSYMRSNLREQKLSPKLSPTHARTLFIVFRNPEIKTSQLAYELGITTSTVTSTVDSLVKVNLLKRIRMKEDRRTIMLQLTPQGKKFLAGALKLMAKKMKAALDSLNKDEKQLLLKVLTKIEDGF